MEAPKLTVLQSANLDHLFGYHPPRPEDREHFEAITAAAKHFAREILLHTPVCSDQSAAIRLVREARMTANAAIALHREPSSEPGK